MLRWSVHSQKLVRRGNVSNRPGGARTGRGSGGVREQSVFPALYLGSRCYEQDGVH